MTMTLFKHGTETDKTPAIFNWEILSDVTEYTDDGKEISCHETVYSPTHPGLKQFRISIRYDRGAWCTKVIDTSRDNKRIEVGAGHFSTPQHAVAKTEKALAKYLQIHFPHNELQEFLTEKGYGLQDTITSIITAQAAFNDEDENQDLAKMTHGHSIQHWLKHAYETAREMHQAARLLYDPCHDWETILEHLSQDAVNYPGGWPGEYEDAGAPLSAENPNVEKK